MPSMTTTIKLTRLPLGITETKLRESMVAAKIDARKVMLEPGCAVLLYNEAEAELAARSITAKFPGSSCQIRQTTMPSLLLQNLPDTVSAQSLQAAFAAFQPKSVQMIGGASLSLTVRTPEHALAAQSIISSMAADGQTLRSRLTKLPSGDFLVHVSNLPPGANADTVKTQLLEALQGPVPGAAAHLASSAASSTATIRFPASVAEAEAAARVKALLQATPQAVGSGSSTYLSTQRIKKPCVVLRRIGDNFDAVEGLLGSPRRVTSKVPGEDQLIAYYSSEEEAFAALAKVRGMKLNSSGKDGKPVVRKISASYRELIEPVCRVRGLPRDCEEKEVRALFAKFDIHSVVLRVVGAETGDIEPAGAEAFVCMNTPKDAKLAAAALSRRPFRGHRAAGGDGDAGDAVAGGSALRVTVDESMGCDVGVLVGVAAKDEAALWALLQLGRQQGDGGKEGAAGASSSSAGPRPVSALVRSSRQAHVAFDNVQQAAAALESFVLGKAAIEGGGGSTGSSSGVSGGLVTSHISALPSFALEVQGLGLEVPAAEVEAAALAGGLSVLRVDRSGILKFRRHLQIVPALRALRLVTLEGATAPLRAERFRPPELIGNSAYDRPGVEGDDDAPGGGPISDESLDTWSLKHLLKDYMHTDPGLRFQIAKNAFERALVDAKSLKDIHMLLERSISPAIRDEARALLSQKELSKDSTARLFELFLQREDVHSFVEDFREMSIFFGDANESDPFDWSQFKIEDNEDVVVLRREMARLEAAESAKAGARPGGAQGTRSKKDIMVIDGVEGFEGGTAQVSLEDPGNLIDKDGRMWSGAILDTDMVQKTMPGNRVNSHRSLVVVGNMRGACGFGMGKGKTTGDATNAAFR